MRKRWLDMVRRQNFEPNYQSRLCSIYYIGPKGPTKDNPVPTLFSYNNYGGRLNTNADPPPVREIASALTAQTTADTALVTDTVVTDTESVTLMDSNHFFLGFITTYSPFLQITLKLSYFHILEIHCERQH